ncbi:LysR family transcriptional regulator [Leucobacter luti]|uniref:LysR family transcriptional regulator n=1 Tax=Leucobacter luti TaxID=340320 RepID=UPI001C691D49|nr:LysR family transcriptional regulator [Leucobacter luti]QYM75678.1 LysR family transcriptional regulator [Leucobacter luti]
MDTRRLRFLLELSRLGSMRAVADVLRTSTSTVSQQISLLAQELGTDLVSPVGRGVRLTPAGTRLAEHAAAILAAVHRAQLDLDPTAAPAGTVRVAGFSTAIRRAVLPVVRELAETHPRVSLEIHQHEPAEALAMLSADQVDVAITYDYDLAPMPRQPEWATLHLWSTPWSLGVPEHTLDPRALATAAPLAAYRESAWIGNSRNRADEDALRIVASVAGFPLQITHAADSLDLVEDLILAGMGVGLLPSDRPHRPGVALLPLRAPGVNLRTFLQLREGRDSWPALALVRDRIAAHAATINSAQQTSVLG